METRGNESTKELTIRRHFALEVMKSMLSTHVWHGGAVWTNPNVQYVAKEAVEFADALINRLNEKT